MNNRQKTALFAMAATALVVGCAGGPNTVDLDKLTAEIVKASFRDEGIGVTLF